MTQQPGGRCPHCGSDQITPLEYVVVGVQIKRDASGKSKPAIGTGNTRPPLDAFGGPEYPWSCLDCDASLMDEDLVPDPQPPTTTPNA